MPWALAWRCWSAARWACTTWPWRPNTGAADAGALVQALLHWGAEAGATSAYLQVRAQNTPALRLYESMGFKTAYGYHYRVPG